MFDVGVEPWGDEPVFHAPVFVVTHRAADPIVKAGGTTYTFVTSGPEEALRLTMHAAGGKDVRVSGGADIVRRYLAVGVIEELRLQIVPILLGGGTRLFEGSDAAPLVLAGAGMVADDGVAHLVYRPGG